MSQFSCTRQDKPMIFHGKTIERSSAGNIHSCGPQKIIEATKLCLKQLPKDLVQGGGLIAYDPLCGNGTIPVILSADFHYAFDHVIASDGSQSAVETTRNNFETCNTDNSAPCFVYRHNILLPHHEFITDASLHVVLTDPPYGDKCQWYDTLRQKPKTDQEREDFFRALFKNLEPKMAAQSVIGIITNTRMSLGTQFGAFAEVAKHEIQGCHTNDARSLHIFKRQNCDTTTPTPP